MAKSSLRDLPAAEIAATFPMMPAVRGDAMRGLAVFISDIRNCKSKEAEVKRINKELANIRSKFKGDKTLDGYQKKKYVCKLLFINTQSPLPFTRGVRDKYHHDFTIRPCAFYSLKATLCSDINFKKFIYKLVVYFGNHFVNCLFR